MEPGVVAAAYGAETGVEVTVGAAVAIAKPTMPLKATWQRFTTANPLPRSSHSLSVIKGRIFIFGGEQEPRQPVNNDIHVLTLPSSSTVEEVDYKTIPAKAVLENGSVPSPRVGHTASVINDRGGEAMEALDEQGQVWEFDTRLSLWNVLSPGNGFAFPEPRSYHSSTSTDHPLPSSPDHTANGQSESDRGAQGTVFIHGGCTSSGRLNDLWAFDVASRTWSPFPDAPGPARGGSCLTFTQNRLYRFGGFDGNTELGRQIDYLDISATTFNDKGGKGELGVVAASSQWEVVQLSPEVPSPGNRSVAGFEHVTTGQGRNYLLLFLGEKSPSSLGHSGAGEFWDDVWSYQIRPQGMTAASFKDATRELVGAKTGEGTWMPVDIPKTASTHGARRCPGELGWFASDQGHDMGPSSVVLWGGVKSNNERANDGWILTVE
ncbi:MAG: hypothetical protein Q9190_000503 [Brigantiaea leucoxantha]